MPKQNHGKTNKEYAEGIQNTTKKNEELLLVCVNGYHCIILYMKQQQKAKYDIVTAISRGSCFMNANEHTKVFINKMEETTSVYTKTEGNYQR